MRSRSRSRSPRTFAFRRLMYRIMFTKQSSTENPSTCSSPSSCPYCGSVYSTICRSTCTENSVHSVSLSYIAFLPSSKFRHEIRLRDFHHPRLPHLRFAAALHFDFSPGPQLESAAGRRQPVVRFLISLGRELVVVVAERIPAGLHTDHPVRPQGDDIDDSKHILPQLRAGQPTLNNGAFQAAGSKLTESALRRSQSFCHIASMNALTNVAATCGTIAFPNPRS